MFSSSRTPRRSSVRAGRSSGGTSRRKRKGRASPRARKPRTSPPREASSALVAVLRSWRLAESKRRRIPAFRIFGDSTLVEIAAARPRDEEALLAIRGVGATIVRKYGDKLLRLIEDGRGS